MDRSFSPETVATILGNVPHKGTVLQRTPLHVEFKNERSFTSAQAVEKRHLKRKTIFNAIGSACVDPTKLHLPVLDIDAPASLSTYRDKTKLILPAPYETKGYHPESNLRDLLGDHGIDMEVFSEPVLEHGRFDTRSRFKTMGVAALVLRTEAPIFKVVPSTLANHRHVYIQQPFNVTDHNLLLTELANVGVIGNNWKAIADAEKMAIVRTPWTEKAPEQYGS